MAGWVDFLSSNGVEGLMLSFGRFWDIFSSHCLNLWFFNKGSWSHSVFPCSFSIEEIAEVKSWSKEGHFLSHGANSAMTDSLLADVNEVIFPFTLLCAFVWLKNGPCMMGSL